MWIALWYIKITRYAKIWKIWARNIIRDHDPRPPPPPPLPSPTPSSVPHSLFLPPPTTFATLLQLSRLSKNISGFRHILTPTQLTLILGNNKRTPRTGACRWAWRELNQQKPFRLLVKRLDVSLSFRRKLCQDHRRLSYLREIPLN